MNAHEFLETLAIVLGVAAVTTVVFQRLHQPVVLGYLIAGLLVGPHLPIPLNANTAMVSTLSELGVILLMFAIGLELSIAKLAKVALTAGIIAVIQVGIMISAGFAIGRAFGWTVLESTFAGAAISISSTTIIAKVFEELKVRAALRDLVYGVLIVEDIIAILILATMTTVAGGSGLESVTLAITTGKLLLFLVGMVVIGLLVVPPLMRFVARLARPETTVVASIGLCFTLAHACAAMHYSVALGAFVAGMLISESGEGHAVMHLVTPVRDMFAAIFFVSVGMLIDPGLVLQNWPAVLALSAVVIVGKIVSVTLGSVVTGASFRSSVEAGVSLSQIGEFSFIIVGLGLSLSATRPFLFPVAVAVSAVTTLTTPTLIRRSERLAAALESRLPGAVARFIAFYGAWLERVRAEPPSSTVGAKLRRLVVLLVLDVAVLMGLVLGGGLLHARMESVIATRFGLGDVTAQVAFAGAAGLACLPFVFGVVRLTRALSLTLAGLGEGGGDEDGGEGAPRRPAARAVALAVQVGLLSAIGIAAAATLEPFVPPLLGVALCALVVVLAGVAFWRNARRFDVEVKAGGATVMGALASRIRAEAAEGAPGQH